MIFMLASFNWLKKYASLPSRVSAEEVATKLKLSTVEVERVIDQSSGLKNIVVGKILSAEKHPQADRLKICQVDIGQEKLRIVCGGSNVRTGMFCAVAKIGAQVYWHGEEKPVEIKEAAIRGEKSYGMICAASEIGLEKIFLAKEEKEIIDLTEYLHGNEKIIGRPLAQALGFDDVIFEIDNKTLSHRPDLWGHYGLAREVATLFDCKLKSYNPASIKAKKDSKLEVVVEDIKLCPRFMAVAMDGVKVGESPDWMKQTLLAVGLRAINNLVDITNYVMLDLGKPMHVFDRSKLADQGSKLIIRKAKAGEELNALDGKSYKLDSSILVVADTKKPVAMAGIIGGEESGVKDGTTSIVFETAIWDPAYIRKTSTKLNLRTDAALRFEKSLDPYWCELSLQRAVELTKQLCPGARVVSQIIDKAKFKLDQGPIKLPLQIFEQKIGFKIPEKTIVSILKTLGFEVKVLGKNLTVKVPSWRATKDISLAEDLVEEVLRIYGYDNIPSQLPLLSIKPPLENKFYALERNLRDLLIKKLEYSEVRNYSFISREQIDRIGDDLKKYIELDNPVSKEKPFLRRHLLNNLLENILKNIEYFSELRLLETGKVYLLEEKGEKDGGDKNKFLPRQDDYLVAVYASKGQEEPFWQARRVMEDIAHDLHFNLELKPLKDLKSWHHIGRSSEIIKDGHVIGSVYELPPPLGKLLGLGVRVGVCEINLSSLVQLEMGKVVYEPISVFPEVERDLAILVKQEVGQAEVKAAIMKVSPLLKKVDLFDFYAGDKIKKGYKSLAYHLTFSLEERTLTSVEVDEVIKKIVATLIEKFGGELRV